MATVDRLKKLWLPASGIAAGGFLFAFTSEHGWLKSLLWAAGTGVVGAAVLWLAGVGESESDRNDSAGR